MYRCPRDGYIAVAERCADAKLYTVPHGPCRNKSSGLGKDRGMHAGSMFADNALSGLEQMYLISEGQFLRRDDFVSMRNRHMLQRFSVFEYAQYAAR